MRFRLIILAVVAVALGVSVATAAPSKGKPPKSGANCRPNVGVVLKGTFTSASGDSFTMAVLHANHHGQAYKKAGSATVNVDAKTKMKRNGKEAKLSDLAAGDLLNVKAKACRAD